MGTPLRTKGDLVSNITPMSNSLKERLKRCGRYHARSPVITSTNPSLETSLNSKEVKEAGQTLNCEAAMQNPSRKRKLIMPDKSNTDSHYDSLQNNQDICQQKDYHTQVIDSNNTENKKCDQSVGNVLPKPNHLHNSSDIVPSQASVFSTNQIVSMHSDPAPPRTEQEENVQSQVTHLEMVLKNKLELLRKLKMVKMYREKNDLTELQRLIDKWRGVSQTALTDLQSLHPEPKPSLGDLLTHLQVDVELLCYNSEVQEFVN